MTVAETWFYFKGTTANRPPARKRQHAIQFSNVPFTATFSTMHWLQTLDTNLFLFFNRSLVNPVFDWLMPVLSGSNGVKTPFLVVVIAIGIFLSLIHI